MGSDSPLAVIHGCSRWVIRGHCSVDETMETYSSTLTKAHKVKAAPAELDFHVSQPTVTHRKASRLYVWLMKKLLKL